MGLVTGKIISFDGHRGYGFVSPDAGGDDVFVHVNDFDFDKYLAAPGARVEFMAEQGDRGLKASSVRLLRQPEPAAAKPVIVARPVVEGDDIDEVLCEVLSSKELSDELTERLLATVPDLTGRQILAVRQCVAALATVHRWIED